MSQFESGGKKIRIDSSFKTAEDKKKRHLIEEEEWMIFNIFHNFLSIKILLKVSYFLMAFWCLEIFQQYQ